MSKPRPGPKKKRSSSKKPPSFGTLRRKFDSFEKAVDGGADMSPSVARKKTLTLRYKKRMKEFSELEEFWGGDEDPTQEVAESAAEEELPVLENDVQVAETVLTLIAEHFSTFWDTYDSSFDKEAFLVLGEEGWDAEEASDTRLKAREPINAKKNQLHAQLCRDEPFVVKSFDLLHKMIDSVVVSGLKRRQIKHAVRRHCKKHLERLIFPPKE